MHHHPGGFVDGGNAIVLVEDPERDVFGKRSQRLRRRWFNLHDRACAQLVRRLPRHAFDANAARFDPLLNPRAAVLEQAPGDKVVQALASFGLGDLVAKHYFQRKIAVLKEMPMRRGASIAAVAILVLAARLAHAGILWVEEAYPTAAAIELLRGKVLYRDIWFDKPPLFPSFYLLWGARSGWPLRIGGALFVLGACWIAGRLARELWGEREGWFAAALTAFFFTFDVPAAAIALTPDLLLVPLQAGAIWMAVRGNPLASGFLAGIGLLFNSKALLVLAVCALWQWTAAPALVAGFLIPLAAAAGWMAWQGSLAEYWRQVWRWGALYARDSPYPSPLLEGLRRTVNWAGFHATLIAGAAWFWCRDRSPNRARTALWAALSFAGVCLGWRFFPRYYFHFLPVMTVCAARGLALMGSRVRLAALLLMVIPFIRYAPGYVYAAFHSERWRDLALYRDSVDAAGVARRITPAGSTLFVWGYRPELYPLTGFPAGTRFLDSQPVNGVFADRHLTSATVSAPDFARQGKRELTRTAPTLIIDGLGTINPALALERQPELAAWLEKYEMRESTPLSRIWVLR
jgi:hypothetical protein